MSPKWAKKAHFGDIFYNVFNRRKSSYLMLKPLNFTISWRRYHYNESTHPKLIFAVSCLNICKNPICQVLVLQSIINKELGENEYKCWSLEHSIHSRFIACNLCDVSKKLQRSPRECMGNTIIQILYVLEFSMYCMSQWFAYWQQERQLRKNSQLSSMSMTWYMSHE